MSLHPDGTDAVIRYASTITSVGAMVPGFVEAGILVIFAGHAPRELHEICVLHQPSQALSAPRPTDIIEIGSHRAAIQAVGDAVAANLLELGHASLKADGRAVAALPGDICLPVGSLRLPRVGDLIRIVST